jgi:hypothetical protein
MIIPILTEDLMNNETGKEVVFENRCYDGQECDSSSSQSSDEDQPCDPNQKYQSMDAPLQNEIAYLEIGTKYEIEPSALTIGEV